MIEWKNEHKVQSTIRIKLQGEEKPEKILIKIYCYHIMGNLKSWYHENLYTYPTALHNPKILENFGIALNFAFMRANNIKHKDLTTSKKLNW